MPKEPVTVSTATLARETKPGPGEAEAVLEGGGLAPVE
jgi:hypothetical protein